MQEIEITDNATIPVSVVARVLKCDCQTVRVLLQQKLVPWGIAYKLPQSRQYSYLIYAKAFYEATGYLYKGGVSE